MNCLKHSKWAYAIAERISDEWDGSKDFPEDTNILRCILYELFLKTPEACELLIGTGIIEEDYFNSLE